MLTPLEDVPPARPYDVDGDVVTPAARYRQVVEKLGALGYGYGDHEVMRALIELERLRPAAQTPGDAVDDAPQSPEKYGDLLLRKAYELAEQKIGAIDFLQICYETLAAVEDAKKLTALARTWRHARTYGQRTPDECAADLLAFVATGELPAKQRSKTA